MFEPVPAKTYKLTFNLINCFHGERERERERERRELDKGMKR
jgi:hypothetical protein